jgi:hypothetical protein
VQSSLVRVGTAGNTAPDIDFILICFSSTSSCSRHSASWAPTAVTIPTRLPIGPIR